MSCATLKRPLDSDLFSPTSHPAAKRRRLAVRGLFGIGTSSSSASAASASISMGEGSSPSPFASVSSRLSPEQMQIRLRQEIRHLRRLKQLHTDMDKEESPSSSPRSNSLENEPGCDNFGEKMKLGLGQSKDCALFSFKQVGLICQRMLQEKEDALRREYETALSAKLNEQYSSFVIFTHDQIQKQFEATSAPSYLS